MSSISYIYLLLTPCMDIYVYVWIDVYGWIYMYWYGEICTGIYIWTGIYMDPCPMTSNPWSRSMHGPFPISPNPTGEGGSVPAGRDV